MKNSNLRGLRWMGVWSVLAWGSLTGGMASAAVAQLHVRIVTGAEDLTAGSVVALRVYVAGRPVQEFALTHGESWPRDSTRVIPLMLSDGLDPRTVVRFGLYYRAASPLAAPWEVAAADVDVSTGRATPVRLLDTTLSGVITRQGELASEQRDAREMQCTRDADCDDHRRCNGLERCAPRTAGADARGCVRGAPLVCPVNQVCSEGHGCRGPDTSAPPR